MLFSTKLFASTLAFAVSIAASPLDLHSRGSSVIIGYRVVRPGQATEYKDAGNTLTYVPSKNPAQLGPGVYTSPGIGQWTFLDDDVYCAILADSTAWSNVNKAWVPKSYRGCNQLWYPKSSSDIPNYLKELDPSFTTANTVLLGGIAGSGFGHLSQALIPPQLLSKSAGLNINVQCYSKQDASGIALISAYGDVDYVSWNAKGPPYVPQ
ncbi:MAG: hypothetical protein MMC23_003602 [Stictis urceolatum]|nr:hypothetical protein [Stictis urceolata]